MLDTRPVSEGSLSVRVLAAVALLGGILQFVATVRLGFAPLSALQAAAAEGADSYLLLAVALIVGGLAVWKLRHRWILAATIAVLWQAAIFWPLHDRLSSLGLVFHGEALLHHFLTFISIAVVMAIVRRWSAVGFGPRALRWLLAAMAAAGLPLLAVAHVAPVLGALPPASIIDATTAGSAATLALWPLAWGLLVRSTAPSRWTFLALVITVPPSLRVFSTGWSGLRGESIPDIAVPWVVAALVGAASLIFFLYRPIAARSGRAFAVFVSAIATSILYVLYRKRFGELEESLGGLHQSLFAFNLPYPPYVDSWQLIAVMVAVFFILTSAYSALLSHEDRGIGISLGLLVVSGIGFTTPQLVLMSSAGFLLLVEEVRRQATAPLATKPPVAVEELMIEISARLGLEPPIVLEQAEALVSAVRGELEGLPLQIRVRAPRRRPWEVVLHVGILGRDRPAFELEPGSHPGVDAAETRHRVRGPARSGERIPEAVFLAFAPFPTAHGRFWATGTEVVLGSDLTSLDPPHLEQLIRALRRAAD